MAVQAAELKLWMGKHLLRCIGCRAGTQRETELLILYSGGHCPVGVRVNAGRDPDEHPLTAWREGRDACDLREAVDHDAPYAVVKGGVQVRWRFGISVQDEALAWEPCRARNSHFARRADVKREAFLPDPAGHRAAPEGLARVGDFLVGEGPRL